MNVSAATKNNMNFRPHSGNKNRKKENRKYYNATVAYVSPSINAMHQNIWTACL